MADIPMGEFWHASDCRLPGGPFLQRHPLGFPRPHTYGKRIAQAEAFTSWVNWQEYPAALKAEGDHAFCDGLNRNVLCFYVHQPRPEEKPGHRMDGRGHGISTVTLLGGKRAGLGSVIWRAANTCFSRARFHADVCYFYGEGSARFVPGREFMQPALPAGYNYDCVNSDVLFNRMSVREGRLWLPDGMSYALMVLPLQTARCRRRCLRRIKELIEAGATVTGVAAAGRTGTEPLP